MKPSTVWIFLLLPVLCVLHCDSCRQKSRPQPTPAASLLSLIPADAALALWAGRPGRVLDQAQALAARFKGTLLGLMVEEGLQLIRNRTRVDLGSAEALKRQGINPEAGAAVFARLDPAGVYLLAAVTDQALAEKTLRHVLSAAFSLTRFEPGEMPGLTLAKDQQARARAAYLFLQGRLVLAFGEPPATGSWAQAMKSVVRVPASASLEQSPSFKIHKDRVNPEQGIAFYLSEAALQAAYRRLKLSSATKSLAGAVSLDAAGLTAEGLAEFPPEIMAALAQGFPAAAASSPPAPAAAPAALSADAGVKGPAENLGRFLMSDTLAALVVNGDPAAVLEAAFKYDPRLKAAFEQWAAALKTRLGVDLEKELRPLLAGRAAVSLYRLTDQALLALLDPSKGAFGDFLEACVLVAVQDPKAMAELLKKLGQAMNLKPHEVMETLVYDIPEDRFTTKSALKLALKDQVLIAARGPGRVTQMLRRLSGSYQGLAEAVADQESRDLLTRPGMNGALVPITTLAANLKDLEGKLVLRGQLLLSSMVAKAVDIARRFKQAAFLVTFRPEGVAGRLTLR